MTRTSVDRFEQRKQTRAKLIDAALRLFSTRGYEHATVDDIAQAAGYSKGAYYFHFSTKDDILLELLRVWTEDRTAVLESYAGEADADSLAMALSAFFSYDQDAAWRSVLLEFWAQATRNTEVSKRLNTSYATWRKQLSEMFANAASAGHIAVASAQDAASVALAAHDGYAIQNAIEAPGAQALTPARLAETLLQPFQTAASAADRRAAAL
jgi:AcrR family transcriptional regulator